MIWQRILAIILIEGVMVVWTLGAIAWCNHVSPIFDRIKLMEVSRILTWTFTSMLCVHLTAEVLRLLVDIAAG